MAKIYGPNDEEQFIADLGAAGVSTGEMAHLLELDDRADTLGSIAELAWMDFAAAAEAYAEAERVYVVARRAVDNADADYARARELAVTERRRLGVLLTAGGYRTPEQIRQIVAAHQGRAERGEL